MCTRVLWADNGQAVVIARNMDWKDPWPVDLWASPRGIARDGQTGANTLVWTARHGSVVASRYGATDGMNEKGLAGHLLWLSESNYGQRDPAQRSLSTGQWLQYYLDNFASVREAIEWTQANPFQLVTVEFGGLAVTVHLALEDASGDSAVIEYIDGLPHIHHDRQYTVVTNSPPFEQQLAGLQRYIGFGGDASLPGTTDPADRYVRAAYYLKHLPSPANYREAVAGVLSVLRNVAQPFGTVDPARPNVSPTRWRTVCDATNGVYFFEATTSPFLVWVRLAQFDFAPGTGVRKVDLSADLERYGDVSAYFELAEPFVVPVPGE